MATNPPRVYKEYTDDSLIGPNMIVWQLQSTSRQRSPNLRTLIDQPNPPLKTLEACSVAILQHILLLIGEDQHKKMSAGIRTTCGGALELLATFQVACFAVHKAHADFADVRAFLLGRFKKDFPRKRTSEYADLQKKARIEIHFALYVLNGAALDRWAGLQDVRTDSYRKAPRTTRIEWFITAQRQKINDIQDSESLLKLLKDLPILHFLTPEQNDVVYHAVGLKFWNLAKNLSTNLYDMTKSDTELMDDAQVKGMEEVLRLLDKLDQAHNYLSSRQHTGILPDVWPSLERLWRTYKGRCRACFPGQSVDMSETEHISILSAPGEMITRYNQAQPARLRQNIRDQLQKARAWETEHPLGHVGL